MKFCRIPSVPLHADEWIPYRECPAAETTSPSWTNSTPSLNKSANRNFRGRNRLILMSARTSTAERTNSSFRRPPPLNQWGRFMSKGLRRRMNRWIKKTGSSSVRAQVDRVVGKLVSSATTSTTIFSCLQGARRQELDPKYRATYERLNLIDWRTTKFRVASCNKVLFSEIWK